MHTIKRIGNTFLILYVTVHEQKSNSITIKKGRKFHPKKGHINMPTTLENPFPSKKKKIQHSVRSTLICKLQSGQTM